MDNDQTTLDVEVSQDIKADLRRFNKAEDQVNKAVAALGAIVITKPDDVPVAMDILKKAKTVDKLIEDKRKELVKPFRLEIDKINSYAKNLTDKLPPAIEAGKKIVLDWQKAEEEKALKQRTEGRVLQLINIGAITVDQEGAIILSHPEVVNISLKLIQTADDNTWKVLFQDWTESINQINNQQLESLENQKDFAETFGSEKDKKEINDKIQSIQQPVAAPVLSSGNSSFSKIKGSTKTWVFEVEDINLVPREYLVVDEIRIRKNVIAGVRDIPGVRIYQKDGLAIR